MKKKVGLYLFISCILFLAFILFRQRKEYVLSSVNETTRLQFCTSQLNELKDKNAIMKIMQTAVIFKQSSSMVFLVFSKKNFELLKIKDFEISYDGKVKTIYRNNVYKPDDENQNVVKAKTYTVDGIDYSGVEKLVFPTFNTKDFCWINFHNLFKWKHGKLGDTFPVKIVVHYFLDDEEYYEEMNFQVRCQESYPDRLYKAFFCFE